MTELSGYVFSALRGGEFTLYRGSGDGLEPILLVAPIGEYSARESLKRLEHEYDLKAELDAGWAVRPVALSRHNGRMALVLEDPGGEPLDQLLGQPMDVTRFLHIAIPLATALRGVHERNLIHKDIKPANILVDVASGGVWLTGFGIASRLPRERQPPAPPEIIAGTLAYMAPEQTGRMNRSIDARSDLYSLGITFYEMLTGTLPFTAADPMEWVHCHIARQPAPPDERVAGVPGPLSAIVMKLLAKTAEDRYQTAAGVEADLRRCLAEWRVHRRIDPFPLAAHDVSDRLVIPEKLYGRAREIETLLAAFDRVVQGGAPELVLVSGYSGIGKSSVVNELHKVLVPPHGLFAGGKFDRYKRDIPYATLAQAFQSLVRPLLAKSETELNAWRDALREVLGPNGQLMVDLVPDLKLIIGNQPQVPDLPPQDAQRRFQLVFRRFIGVFARPEHPLALFLDDLQWLDAATLDLLEDLLTQTDLQHLLLIGAYRDNEVTAVHSLRCKLDAINTIGGRVAEITLAPLAREHLGQLIGDALRCEPERAAPLAQLVHEKTSGNPFFAIQFLSSLEDEGLLAFDHDAARWSWDPARIHAKGYTDNVVDLMVGKLTRLPAETQNVLQQLACLGNVTEITILSIVLGKSNEDVRTDLWDAVRLELVEDLRGSYKFIHDRVQEAAYSLIPERLRTEAHLRIGRLLAAHTPAEKREEAIFEIVNQLNRGAALITSRDERVQLAELNLTAGKRAKASTAYASALTYLTAGAALLPDDSWELRHELAFALELRRGECEFLTGALAEAEERLAALSSRAANTVDRATVACLRVDLYMTLDQASHAIAVGLDYLRQAGIEWSPHPTDEEVRREYDQVWSRLGGRSIEECSDLPLMRDPDSLAILDVLIKIAPTAIFTDHNLLALTVCRAVNLSLERGNCDGSCLAYVMLGMVAGARFGDYQAAYRFGQLGYDLIERHGLKRFQARAYINFAVCILPWTKHVRDGREVIRRAFEAANQIGDVVFATYACGSMTTNLLAAGDPLVEVQREVEHARAFAHKARFGLIVDIMSVQLGLVRTLRGLTPKFGSFDFEQFDELQMERHFNDNPNLALAECGYWIRKMQAHFLSGDCASAIDASLRAQQLIWTAQGNFEVAEYHFYAALSRAAACDTAAASERQQHVDALVVHHRQLEVWAEHCPENFENRAALVGAEIARLEGCDLDAQRLYEQAIRSARTNGFVHNEALAYEVTARFYAAGGFDEIARLYLRNARYCYVRWGADGKVRQLEQLHPHLRNAPVPASPTTTFGTPVEHLDVGTVVKASQAVSGEIELGKLIETLMRIALEHAGAERGLLILLKGDEPQIVAEANAGQGRVEVTVREAAVSPLDLPQSALHYVIRTRESVVLDDASARNLYSDDEYIRQQHPRSVLCLPILKQTKLVGALYLENNLTPYAFTSSRVAVLELLASQAAISLENARLYSEVQRENTERRRVEEELRHSEAYLAEAQRLSRTGSFGWSVATGDIIWSDETFRIFGYDNTPSVTIDMVVERTHPDDRAAVQQTIDRAARDGKDFSHEYRLLLPDGSVTYVHAVARAAKDASGNIEFVGAVTDITGQHQARTALEEAFDEIKKSEDRLRLVIDTIPSMVWSCTPEGSIDFASQSLIEYFGQSLEELVGTGWASAIHPDDVGQRIMQFSAELAAGKPFEREFRGRRSDGEYRWVVSRGVPLGDKQGNIVKWYGTITDIHERKQGEDALRESQQRFRDYAETASDWFWETGPDHRFIYLSEQIATIGINAARRIGSMRGQFATDIDEEPEKWRQHLANLDAHRPFRGFVFRIAADDGSAHYVAVSGKPVFDAEGHFLGYRGVGSDLTASVRAEQAEEALHKTQMELAHVARVTTLGELAASIAHEVNQPLAAIVTNGEVGLRWLDREVPDLAEAREALGGVISNGRRASEIIHRLRSLSKKTETQKAALDINGAISEMIPLVQQEVINHRVSLHLDLAPTLPAVLGDRVQLQQVIINLIVNGMEAMAPVTDRPRQLVVRSQLDDSGQVLVAVEDSGTGIDPEDAKQLFNAFFTTKPSGMGMGLSICRSIIENHGGTLWASRNAGPGATFQFTLRLHQEARS